jgi:circadian clock protein KaiC
MPGKKPLNWHPGAERRFREQERKRNALETKIAALRAEFDVETLEVHLMAKEEQKRQNVLADDRLEMAHLRKGKPSAPRALSTRKKRERRVR